MIWNVILDDPRSPYGIGTVGADTYAEAVTAADETFHTNEGESLRVQKAVEGKTSLVLTTRLRKFRQDHLPHKLQVGTVVKVEFECFHSPLGAKGVELGFEATGTFVVVSQNRDCDGTPLYSISTEPYTVPTGEVLLSRLVHPYLQTGMSERKLTPVGAVLNVRPWTEHWASGQ